MKDLRLSLMYLEFAFIKCICISLGRTYYLKLILVSSKRITLESFKALSKVCNVYIDTIRKEEEITEQKKQEEQETFKYKAKTYTLGVTREEEEEHDSEDIQKLFPDFMKDFEDLRLDSKEMDSESNKEQEVGEISPQSIGDEEVYHIFKIHRQIFVNLQQSISLVIIVSWILITYNRTLIQYRPLIEWSWQNYLTIPTDY